MANDQGTSLLEAKLVTLGIGGSTPQGAQATNTEETSRQHGLSMSDFIIFAEDLSLSFAMCNPDLLVEVLENGLDDPHVQDNLSGLDEESDEIVPLALTLLYQEFGNSQAAEAFVDRVRELGVDGWIETLGKVIQSCKDEREANNRPESALKKDLTAKFGKLVQME